MEYAVHKLEQQFATNKGLLKKITLIAVEMTQNIQKYSTTKEGAVFSVVQLDNQLIMSSVNEVSPTLRKGIEEKLDYINQFDPISLKENYLEKMADGSFNEKGGAGLGFYVMRMKSGNPIHVSFEDKDNKLFLKIKVSINID